ncbi:hypothetical protein HMPREF9371_1697 [Neisseria shayeganii 871]|uniref:Uncharacterized protein n=1 Tax=Neisseria shayeganii 871 TaxID=1032488 RepID=G4CJA8_9NEIS|nr:hypothetical protein HMPREF9371_1697 [Neisseria shayeganii 871]
MKPEMAAGRGKSREAGYLKAAGGFQVACVPFGRRPLICRVARYLFCQNSGMRCFE